MDLRKGSCGIAGKPQRAAKRRPVRRAEDISILHHHNNSLGPGPDVPLENNGLKL